MIEATHSAWAKAAFHLYILRLLKRSFHGIHLLGQLPEADHRLPILLLPNHNSWWDGFFVYLFNRNTYNRPVYLMMLEEQLKKYHFFSKVGAYSIDPGKPKSVVESLRYTTQLLKSDPRNTMVCMFPQGELLPFSERVQFEKGYEWVIKNTETEIQLLPLAMRVEMKKDQYPDAFVQAGKLIRVSNTDYPNVEELSEIHSNLLHSLVQNIQDDVQGVDILKGKRSAHERFDTFVANK